MLQEFSLDMGLGQRFNPPGPRNFNERVERECSPIVSKLSKLQGKPLHNYRSDSLVASFVQVAEMMIFLSSRMIIGYQV